SPSGRSTAATHTSPPAHGPSPSRLSSPIAVRTIAGGRWSPGAGVVSSGSVDPFLALEIADVRSQIHLEVVAGPRPARGGRAQAGPAPPRARVARRPHRPIDLPRHDPGRRRPRLAPRPRRRGQRPRRHRPPPPPAGAG